MTEHLTFFGNFTNLTEKLYWDLQFLYDLERKDTLSDEQKSEYIKYRMAVRSGIRDFRLLLERIEREHGLEPIKKVFLQENSQVE